MDYKETEELKRVKELINEARMETPTRSWIECVVMGDDTADQLRRLGYELEPDEMPGDGVWYVMW